MTQDEKRRRKQQKKALKEAKKLLGHVRKINGKTIEEEVSKMRKTLFVLLFLTSCLFVSVTGGCTHYYQAVPGVTVYSNIPYHTFTLTIVNGAGGLLFDVIHDGNRIYTDVKPGLERVIRMWNYSATTAQSSIAIVARTPEGEFVGTADRSFSVSGRHRQSKVWLVRRQDIK